MKKKEDIKEYKACPRCAKKNEIEEKKCSKCGYDFKKKGKSIWINVIISAMFVIILVVLKLIDNGNIVGKVRNMFRIISIGMVVCLFISTLSYGSTEKIMYPGDEVESYKKKLLNFKIVSIISLLVALVLGIIGVYYYLTYVK